MCESGSAYSGAAIRAGSGGRLRARIVATPDACADCLSPEPVMRSIMGAALRCSGLDGLTDELSGIEFCYEQGWTDGLPVVPPTADLVARMLTTGGLAPDALLGEIPDRRIAIRAQQAAINAVMAGCLPEYFPVAVRGLLDPAFGLHGRLGPERGALGGGHSAERSTMRRIGP